MASPYSYVTYTSDGTQTAYAVPFPFLERDHVHVLLEWKLADDSKESELVAGTDFDWTSDTQITLRSPAANGKKLSVVRQTPISTPISAYVDGSYLTADDLNLSDLQVLYAVQEYVDRAINTGSTAVEAHVNALEAKVNALAANTAAGQAQTDSSNALAQVQTAVTAANTATAAANSAASSANSAIAEAAAAKTAAAQANTAATQANTAATKAQTDAADAEAKAQQALDAISQALPTVLVDDVAAIPGSPAADEVAEILNSTGIESFTPLTGLPSGFTGDAGIRVRIQWDAGGSTWEYRSYAPNDPDTRYLKPPLQAASTSQAGVVQLDDNPASTATDKAATPRALKSVGDLARGAITDATAASTAAANAQTTANQAATAAGNAATAASAAQAAATDADTKAAAAEAKATAAETKATAAETAATEADTRAQSAILQAQEAKAQAQSAETIANEALSKGGNPTGTIIWVAMQAAPTGYLKANGAAVSRTTYADLFAAIGTTFGTGDGSSTFNLPDLRGEFIRGWDDGRGVDTGRGFGSFQADEFKSHTHLERWNINSSGQDQAGTGSGDNDNTTTGQTGAAGGSETRPRNVALLACIKT